MTKSAHSSTFKYTRHALKKLEQLFSEASFKVRYEKGNFQSGYCILERHQIAVVNKFFDVEARFNCLLEILERSDMDLSMISEDSRDYLQRLIKTFDLQIVLPEVEIDEVHMPQQQVMAV